jgi:hypothetical protein
VGDLLLSWARDRVIGLEENGKVGDGRGMCCGREIEGVVVCVERERGKAR